VGLSDATGPDEDDVGALAHEVEGGGALDDVAVDGCRSGEVVGVEGGHREDARALDGRAGALFEMHPELLAHQVVDDARRRIVARDGLL
jgi:hypothetical protein